jgi:mRNA interferase MazF
MKSPQRGEVWLVDLGMAAKIRPAVVISVPADDSDRALVTLVPHTTSPRNSRFEVEVSLPILRAGVLDAQNLITIPHAKLVRVLGKLTGTQLGAVERVCAHGSDFRSRGPRSNSNWSRRTRRSVRSCRSGARLIRDR